MIEQKYLDLLTELNTDSNPHSGAALIDHLRGTYEYLKAWENPEYVCLGGLFHSIYGTQSYKTQSASFDDRQTIRAVIGNEAEELAFLFCVTQRQKFFENLDRPDPILYDQMHDQNLAVTPKTIGELIEIEIANYREFITRLDFTHKELDKFSARVDSAQKLISPLGYQAITAAVKEKYRQIND